MSMIEQMKENLVKYAELTIDEKNCLCKAHRSNCVFLDDSGKWFPLDDHDNMHDFDNNYRYRIRPDYQPEPEVEKCRVTMKNMGSYKVYSYFRYNLGITLQNALNDPNFIGYEYENGVVGVWPRIDNSKTNPAEYPKYVLFAK
jgi:hypothetical protein